MKLRWPAAYGAPSQAGFGSAVFTELLAPADDLAERAVARYQHCLGDQWSAAGADTWLASWREVYRRPEVRKHDIVAELRSITDSAARLSVPMILDVVTDSASARSALAAAYDDDAITDLRVFTLGDGAAMSGLLVCAEERSPRTAIFLVFLLD